jgi:tetratricopeptide (TPR) repeat protein
LAPGERVCAELQVKLNINPRSNNHIFWTFHNRSGNNFSFTSREVKSQIQLIREALDAMENQDYQVALDLIDQALALTEQNYLANAHFNKGVILNALDKVDQAKSCYEEAIRLKPDYEKAWVNLGDVLLKHNKYSEALVAFEKANTIVPDGVLNLMNKAYCLNRLRRYTEALSILADLEGRTLKDPDVAQTLSYLLFSEIGLASIHANHLEKALKNFEKAFRLNGTDFQICFNLAWLHETAENFQQAEVMYDLVIKYHPHQFRGHMGKACTLIRIGKFQEAIALLTSAEKIAPLEFQVHYNLACAYAGLRNRNELIRALHQCITLAPHNTNVRTAILNDKDFSYYLNDPEFIELLRQP